MLEYGYKRINTVHQNTKLYSLSGILRDGMFGDKEIAVGIRSNSHYRISCERDASQVGMLIVL